MTFKVFQDLKMMEKEKKIKEVSYNEGDAAEWDAAEVRGANTEPVRGEGNVDRKCEECAADREEMRGAVDGWIMNDIKAKNIRLRARLSILRNLTGSRPETLVVK